MKIRILALGLFFILSHNVYAQTPFYQGKQIRVVVGFTSGGFYDRWARLLSRYMPKYIPGNPEMIVQNMPGAGSVVDDRPKYARRRIRGRNQLRVQRSQT